MKIELYEGNESIDIKTIHGIENALDIKMPKEYVDFMLEQNGGIPKACNFTLPDGSNTSAISEYYPIGEMKSNLYQWNRFRDFSDDFITIADDSGGNQILLRVKGENIGELYFWDHDVDPDEENNMHFLASSLNEFLNMLK